MPEVHPLQRLQAASPLELHTKWIYEHEQRLDLFVAVAGFHFAQGIPCYEYCKKAERSHWQWCGPPTVVGCAEEVFGDEIGEADSEDEELDTHDGLSSPLDLSPIPEKDSRSCGCKERCWPWSFVFFLVRLLPWVQFDDDAEALAKSECGSPTK